jgi:hypothetical protein
MNSARRCTRSLLLMAVALAGPLAPSDRLTSVPAPAPNDSVASVPENAQAAIRPEGRLRKLHLVRPDLIPYPIAYEVYC